MDAAFMRIRFGGVSRLDSRHAADLFLLPYMATNMRPDVRIRPFTIADYDAALLLWRSTEGVEIAEGDGMHEIGRYLARNPGLSRIAEINNTVVGAVLCGHDGRRGFIYHLAVSPDYREQGIGKCLVKECVNGLRSCGITRLTILVAASNPAGRAFWLACGFEDISGALAMGVDIVHLDISSPSKGNLDTLTSMKGPSS